MNPEFSLSIAIDQKGTKRYNRHPLEHTWIMLHDKTLTRARWLLDFTDNHPLLYGSITSGTAKEETTLFSAALGTTHKAKWHEMGVQTHASHRVHEKAEEITRYGYIQITTRLSALLYHADTDTYEEAIDQEKPLSQHGTPYSQLHTMAKRDKTFRRILTLIPYIAQEPSTLHSADHFLALFAVTVGFAQAYSDLMIDTESEGNKKTRRMRKHVMRDHIFIFAVSQFDHGIGDYLIALNEIL